MLRNDVFSTWFVSLYLLLYCILLQINSTIGYAVMMFCFSPVLILWMVFTVLKHGKYSGPELGDKEFGYQDRWNVE